MTDAERTQNRLDAYYAAETAILAGHQSYTVEGTAYTRANLQDVQRMINQLRNELTAMRNGGSIRQTQVVF
ncbi:DUF6148 family protein [Desulfovibrio mangrovi]|uniref:DUF6148 family protein n=1 Tax=Desulfovibrio mangrovi TaxID=2976983 RepID=UPI002248311C|nr:DUF6148 family protein [Desulfovibrio mangrovi]UZP67726.1 DUF6148 family protein [Desulfovibrio mangrovi]